jgi:hypothetical protein
MPLQKIAKQIVSLADRHASTPVLITPPYLSFRPRFFIELTRELLTHTNRSIRVDWHRGMPSALTLLSDQVAAFQARAINRALLQSGLASTVMGSPIKRKHSSKLTSDLSADETPPPDAQAFPDHQNASLQITATIARPGGPTRDLVIGLSDARQELPPWTTAIWLGSSPQEIQRLRAA